MADKQQGPAASLITGNIGGGKIIYNEAVPSSLVDIEPILRVANDMESRNPRVAYRCRFYAVEKAHRLDPTSHGHGVCQFKTALLQRLKREETATSGGERDSDARDLQTIYLHYSGKYFRGLQIDTHKANPTRLIKAYQTAVVLYEVWKAVSLLDSVKVSKKILKVHTQLVEAAEMNSHNILLLDPHPEARLSKEAEVIAPHVLAVDPESSCQVLLRHLEAKIPIEAIKNCTKDFNERNLIARGGYGRVYKGILTWGGHVNHIVAVKRLDVNGCQGKKEFNTEVTTLLGYQHQNIITLIGFCDDNKELILVYEYASNGSLDAYLRDTTVLGGLSWLQILKICIGVASSVDYLHNGVAEKHRIIHRDIKSANVLLDEDWNAKLSDFGLARIGLANQKHTFVITNIAGTHGYTDPQYEKTGFLTKESDVYSFGVVLFEVLCGRLATVFCYHDERRFLHHWARTHYKNGMLDKIVDPRIRNDIKPRALLKFSSIAYQCLQETREERPSISEVAFHLNEALKIQLEDEILQDELLSGPAQ